MPEIDLITGLPIDRAAIVKLEDEGAYNQFARPAYAEHIAHGITPSRLASVLLQAENSDPRYQCELFEDMEEAYPHLLSEMQKFKRAICGLPVTLTPVSDDPAHLDQAKFAEFILKQPGIRAAKFDILDAHGKGYSLHKIVWNRSNPKKWYPQALERWDQKFVRFDRQDGVTPLRRDDKGTYVPLEPGGWVFHRYSAKSGLPVRGGLLRSVARIYMMRRLAEIDWGRFLELFGIPGRMVNLPATIKRGTDDYNRVKAAVRDMGSDLYALLPQGVTMTLLERGGDPSCFSDFLDHCDRTVSKLINGYAQSSDKKTGTLSGGQSAHNSEQAMSWDELKAAAAESLADTLRAQVIIPGLRMQFGDLDEYPMVEISAQDTADQLNYLRVIEVTGAIKRGDLDRDAGVAILVRTFGVGMEDAEKLLGSAGKEPPVPIVAPAAPVPPPQPPPAPGEPPPQTAAAILPALVGSPDAVRAQVREMLADVGIDKIADAIAAGAASAK